MCLGQLKLVSNQFLLKTKLKYCSIHKGSKMTQSRLATFIKVGPKSEKESILQKTILYFPDFRDERWSRLDAKVGVPVPED